MDEMGAPYSPPEEKDTEAITGMPAAISDSASDSDRSRVTKAESPREAAYAVLNGQLPVPS